MPAGKKSRQIQTRLLDWFRKEKRDLPWRRTKDPYHIWVSEVMLQQTQVKTVLPYYRRWIQAFPNLKALASASETRVLKCWEGLGYYSRARNLHQAAVRVVEERQGRVPETREEIMRLPGIGRYTAGAILSIAFGQRVPVVDGNVRRVLSRLFCLGDHDGSSALEKRLWDVAGQLLPKRGAGDFNQALMELGARLCVPKNPRCPHCPVQEPCEARARNLQSHYPPPKIRTPVQKIEVSAGVIQRNGKIYIQQRPRHGLMGGLWEFPGGKREKGESPEDCLRREVREELGVNVAVGGKLTTVRHGYTQFRVTLHVYRCRLTRGRIQAQSCEQWKWVEPRQLEHFPFPAANAKIVELLAGAGRSKRLRGV